MSQALLLADSVRPTFDSVRRTPPASLLLTGEVGVGLLTIANHIGLPIESIVQPANRKGEHDRTAGSISIETIRELYQLSRGASKTKFAIIIDDADRMTIAAQQAFLKLLEEPPASAHFILTSHAPQKLLATIRSRTTAVRIPRISQSASISYLKRHSIDDTTMRQLLFLADGRPSLLHEFATNETKRNEVSGLMRDARELMSTDVFARYVIVSRYADRSKSLRLVDAAIQIVSFTIAQRPNPGLIERLRQLMATSERIAAGGNVKLQLSRFVVQL